jgi:lipopolysaccharide assembly outer membrane protein LptD (OstA)
MAKTFQKTASLILFFVACAAAQAAPPAKKNSDPGGSSAGSGHLLVSGKPLHLSCTRSIRDLEKNILECFGNVWIKRPSDLLTADYALIDLNTERLHAEGNVVYFTPDTVVYGAKMDFNFVTETGIIFEGRVESDKFQLVGEEIERLAIDHFKAREGDYTTCRDCPASWRIAGRSIDLTVDGYAYMRHVFIKVNDAPTLYLPFIAVPVKTRRQSGLLFPRFQPVSSFGLTFVQPYFWAISRSTDATLGAGFYSQRGFKGEGEFRFNAGNGSTGKLNGYYLRDRQFIRDPYYNRWATTYTHNLTLPWKIDQKINFIDASDRDYPRKIGDIPGRSEPALVSDLGVVRSGRDATGWVELKRIRNLLTPGITGFDPNAVQLTPGFTLATTNHRLAQDVPLHWGLNLNYARFWRTGPSFDPYFDSSGNPISSDQFTPGLTPLRRTQRFNLTPELYYTAKLWDTLEVVPSIQYRTYYYLFDESGVPPTARGYLLAQADVGVTMERVYDGSFKHKFRPSITYSNIPLIQQNNDHPFIQQIKTSGNEFDEFDIVPISSESQLYFIPLGNSLTYRFGNKFIFKNDVPPYGYKKSVDITAGQTINFIELRNPPGSRQPLNRFFTFATVDTKRVQGRGEFYYYPYINAPTYNLSVNYIFVKYLRRLLQFQRSLSLGYSYDQVLTNSNSVSAGFNFSLNDYWAVAGNINYRFPTTQNQSESPGIVVDTSAGVTYQSPSQCYKVNLIASRSVDNPTVAVTFNFPVNLTGEGFTNLQEGGGVVPQGH